jgi:hypothetical protein
MSRSFKKNLYHVDGSGTLRKKFYKNYANRVIRGLSKEITISDGSAYKKISNSWDISDYRFRYNGNVRYYFWAGLLEVVEPEPLWKARMK